MVLHFADQNSTVPYCIQPAAVVCFHQQHMHHSHCCINLSNVLKIQSHPPVLHKTWPMNNNTLQGTYIIQPLPDCNECNFLFVSTPPRCTNRCSMNCAPKIPARPVRRGYIRSFAFTLNPSSNCGLLCCKSNFICCAVYFKKLCWFCSGVNPLTACQIKWI